MITIKKLRTLKPGTQERKIAVLLQNFEQLLIEKKNINKIYLKELIKLITETFSIDSKIIKRSTELDQIFDSLTNNEICRRINSLRHEILKNIGTEPSDWDLSFFNSPVSQNYKTKNLVEFKLELFLDDIRSPFNVGAIFRTAEAFGVRRIYLSPDCPSPEHHRAKRTAMGATKMIEWDFISHQNCFNSAKEKGIPIFALELGGISISKFNFPKSALAIIGSEELGISPNARFAAEESLGLISIPIYGKKGSLNVSSAFAIMMHSWASYF